MYYQIECLTHLKITFQTSSFDFWSERGELDPRFKAVEIDAEIFRFNLDLVQFEPNLAQFDLVFSSLSMAIPRLNSHVVLSNNLGDLDS